MKLSCHGYLFIIGEGGGETGLAEIYCKQPLVFTTHERFLNPWFVLAARDIKKQISNLKKEGVVFLFSSTKSLSLRILLNEDQSSTFYRA